MTGQPEPPYTPHADPLFAGRFNQTFCTAIVDMLIERGVVDETFRRDVYRRAAAIAAVDLQSAPPDAVYVQDAILALFEHLAAR